MSDLTAAEWSSKATEQLREYEQQCPDIELFCVGYLIPPVELLESEHYERVTTSVTWYQLFEDFVEQCMKQDQMGEDDQERIRNILKWLSSTVSSNLSA